MVGLLLVLVPRYVLHLGNDQMSGSKAGNKKNDESLRLRHPRWYDVRVWCRLDQKPLSSKQILLCKTSLVLY